MISENPSNSLTNEICHWLQGFKSLREADVNVYASAIHRNDTLIAELYELFDHTNLPQETVDPVCHQLFEFYRSGNETLKQFTIQLLPCLILSYLIAIAKHNITSFGGIETCLLGIYSIEISDKDGHNQNSSFAIPVISFPSIYHTVPPNLATLLPENVCSIREQLSLNVAEPIPQVERITAQNRLLVMTHVLSHYNQNIAKLSPCSHQSLCHMCIHLTEMGFDENATIADSEMQLSRTGSTGLSWDTISQNVVLLKPRIRLSSQFIIELLTGIYFVIFNGQTQLATQALAAVEKRSVYELWADVLLVNNAIKNSIKYNSLGCLNNEQLLISMTLSQPSNQFYSKEVITNATFKATKLPDDIEVIDGSPSNSVPYIPTDKLSKISEFESMRTELATKLRFSRQSRLTVETLNAMSQRANESVDPLYTCRLSTTQSPPSTSRLSACLQSLPSHRSENQRL